MGRIEWGGRQREGRKAVSRYRSETPRRRWGARSGGVWWRRACRISSMDTLAGAKVGARDVRGEGVGIRGQLAEGSGARVPAAGAAWAVAAQSSRRLRDPGIRICRQAGTRAGSVCLLSTREPGVFRVVVLSPRWATGFAQVFLFEGGSAGSAQCGSVIVMYCLLLIGQTY